MSPRWSKRRRAWATGMWTTSSRSVPSEIAARGHHADDLEPLLAQPQRLPQRVLAQEQLVLQLGPDHAHPLAALVVPRRQVSAHAQADLAQRQELRGGAADPHRAREVAGLGRGLAQRRAGRCGGPPRSRRRSASTSSRLSSRGVGSATGMPPVVSFFPGIDDEQVAAQGQELAGHVEARPLAEAGEEDDGRDPDGHAEEREARPQAVAAERAAREAQQVAWPHRATWTGAPVVSARRSSTTAPSAIRIWRRARPPERRVVGHDHEREAAARSWPRAARTPPRRRRSRGSPSARRPAAASGP